MSAVTVAVGVGVVDEVRAKGSTAAKVAVASVDASIDDVRVGSLSSGRIVDVGSCARAAVGDSGETVGWVVLGYQSRCVNLRVGFNVGDLDDVKIPVSAYTIGCGVGVTNLI